MNATEQERLEQNIRRTAGVRALKEMCGIVDADLRVEAARKKWLSTLLRYVWIVLLLVAGLLARYMEVI